MIGQTILNYQIISLLGEGGMGTVYMAEHVKLGRKVAIKVLLPHFVKNELVRSRFINEAKLMSNLQHPNIVTLYDYHEDENGLSLIMELVEGKPLDEYIQEVTGPIQEKEAIQLMKQALEGFGYAHKQGLIHRDIKPSNLIVTKDKEIKILDFGIAKLVSDLGNKLTKTGSHIGTVYYMSPEQVRGKELDSRSDIYSLGITFYQMLTGFCPYEGLTTEFDVFNKIVGEELPDPRTIYPGISEHMCRVIQKATAKKPEDRFQTCAAFIKGLKKDDFVLSTGVKNDVLAPVIPVVEHVVIEDVTKNDVSNPTIEAAEHAGVEDKVADEIESQKEPILVEEKIEKQENSKSEEKTFVSPLEVPNTKDSDRKKKLIMYASFSLVAVFIIIGLAVNPNKMERTSDERIPTEKDSKQLEAKPEGGIDETIVQPEEKKIESQKPLGKKVRNKNPNVNENPVYQEEESIEYSASKYEEANPKEYLKVSGTYRQNLILDWVIEFKVSNNADYTAYNKVFVEVTYYDENGSTQGSDYIEIDEYFSPNSKYDYKIKKPGYRHTKSIGLSIYTASSVN